MIVSLSRQIGPGLSVLLLFAWIADSHVNAELLYFVNGGEIQHATVIRNGVVRIDSPAGRFEFPEADFRSIVGGFDPLKEWPARAKIARAGTTKDMLAAAWWALENGLVCESTAMIREAHDHEPTHKLALRLAEVLDRLEAPKVDPETTPLLHSLEVELTAVRGPHILLFHQHPENEARERIDLLEQVFTAYYLHVAWRGVDMKFPSERLVSVYLRAQSDYLRFLKSQHAGAFVGTYGYYHPTYRAVIAYDLRSTGKLHDERVTLERLSSESRAFSAERRRNLQRRRLLYETEYRALDYGTAAHEEIHQLVSVSGLAPEPGQFPQWLHEGFAAQFEVIRGGRWAGIGRAHDLRMSDWHKLPEHLNLPALVRDEGYGHGYHPDLYAKSWAIVYFLQKKQTDSFWKLLERFRDRTGSNEPGSRSSAECFESVFGPDLPSLETEWRAFMGTVSTPLEDHRPK